mgnify:CR=1 FL=1
MARIAPSLLAANFVSLGEDIDVMETAGAKLLHLDVMDGHFVPNLSIGPPVITAIRKHTQLILDVHLMISNPEALIETFVEAGADYLSIHYETVKHLDRLIDQIREGGVQPGVVVNPHTPVSLLEDILPKCHHVLVMSVNPGFGGQDFMASSLEKVRTLRLLIEERGLDVKIEIDGGMGLKNTEEAVRSGVDIVVAGSAIFCSPSPVETFRRMQQIADQAGKNH